MGVREAINSKPWMGWALAGAFLVTGVVMYMRLTTGAASPFSADRATDKVTIKFTDDGSTIEMPRGRLYQELMDRGGTVDGSKGIRNPATGALTGFLYDKQEWDTIVQQMNAEMQAALKRTQPVNAKPTGK